MWSGVCSVLFLLLKLRQFLGKREKKKTQLSLCWGLCFLMSQRFSLQRTWDNINQFCRESEGKLRHGGLVCVPSTSLVKKSGEQRFAEWLPAPAATRSPSWGGDNTAEEGNSISFRKPYRLCSKLFMPVPLWLGQFHCLVQGISVLFQVSPLQDLCALFQRMWVLGSAQVRLVALVFLAWPGLGKLPEQIAVCFLWYIQKHWNKIQPLSPAKPGSVQEVAEKQRFLLPFVAILWLL